MLLPVLTALAAAQESDAEKLFRQVENKVRSAKTLQVRFDAALVVGGMAVGNIKGAALLGEDDKVRLEADMSFSDIKSKVTVVSNGDKIWTKASDQPKLDVKESPKGLGAWFRNVLPRAGVFAGLDT